MRGPLADPYPREGIGIVKDFNLEVKRRGVVTGDTRKVKSDYAPFLCIKDWLDLKDLYKTEPTERSLAYGSLKERSPSWWNLLEDVPLFNSDKGKPGVLLNMHYIDKMKLNLTPLVGEKRRGCTWRYTTPEETLAYAHQWAQYLKLSEEWVKKRREKGYTQRTVGMKNLENYIVSSEL